MINLGSLSLQFLDLSGSPLDAVDLNSKTPITILSSMMKFPRRSDITTSDDHFTTAHGSCCIGDHLIFRAQSIFNSLQGIELEPVASGAPPQNSTQLSQLSGLIEQFNTTRGTPVFEVVTRLTAIPNNTDFWREFTIEGQATSDTRLAWCPKLKCYYCPGFEYSLFQHENSDPLILEALGDHLTDILHCERLKRSRLETRRRTRLEAALAT